MKKVFVLLSVLLMACSAKTQKEAVLLKEQMPGKLKEISGIVWNQNSIWAISDEPHPLIFRLDEKGKVQQEVSVQNVKLSDVEAITTDGQYLYVSDVGDNDGDRQERTIVRVSVAGIGKGATATTAGENIVFSFGDETTVEKKKHNEFDCEAVLSHNDSLYLFTKRRNDEQCGLYVIPNKAGKYTARFISMFDTKGLITDAAINPSKNEVALTGYRSGHDGAFVLFLSNFSGNDFFSGKKERVELSGKKEEWQIEGITYRSNDVVYISCEETKKVKATLYSAKRENLGKITPK